MTNKTPPREFQEYTEGAFRYWADCNSDRLITSEESFLEGRRYEFHTQKQALDTLQAELDLARRSMATGDRNWTELIKQLNHNNSRLKRAESLLRDVKLCCRYVGGTEDAIQAIDQYFAEVESE